MNKHFILFLVLAVTNTMNLSAQTFSVCTAKDLKVQLTNLANNPPNNPVTIQFCTGITNLGKSATNPDGLDPEEFPLNIPPGVILQGDYNIFLNPNGTTLKFPFAYKDGSSCISGKPAFIFIMKQNSVFKNICLQGPKGNTQDYRYLPLDCGSGCICTNTAALEGRSSGILVEGKECSINNCEIFGFSFFAVENAAKDTAQMGNFYFHHNYIHNQKKYGDGYGIWLSSITGNQVNGSYCDTSFLTSDFRNYPNRDENAYINNCVFFDNKHDIAGSGNRNSYWVNNCTFSRRSGDNNIDRHTASAGSSHFYACNPFPTGPTGQQCSLKVITKVGGNVTSFQNSIFYSGRGIAVTYPNTVDILPPINPSGEEGKIDIKNNFFNDLTGLGNNGSIAIAAVPDFHSWSLLDPHLSFKQNRFQPIKPIAQNFGIPVAEIESKSNTQATPVTTSQFITVGDVLKFDSEKCFDALGNNTNNPMRYFWRFHEMNDDLKDEMRTNFISSSTPYLKTFNNIGITNVNLMAIDPYNFFATDIAKQQVVIAPATGNAHTYLVFWMKDNFTGRKLIQTAGGCKYDDFDNNFLEEGETGFKKYVRINSKEIILDDIAGDEGWVRYQIEIENDIISDNGCQGNCDTLEIGIKATASGVDANIVRGVSIYIDDVYINSVSGKNALDNGDLELADNSTEPLGWTIIEAEAAVRNYIDCNGAWLSAGTQRPTLSNGDTRSGHLGYEAYTKPRGAGLMYQPGKYAALTQKFNVQCNFEPRITPDGSMIVCGTTAPQLSVNTTGSGYTYKWRINGVYVNNFTPVITPTVSGSYLCLVTNSCGSKFTNSVLVTLHPQQNVSVTPASATICQGNSVSLTATNCDFYAWTSNPVGFTSTSKTITVSPNSSTVYTIVGSSAAGCTATASANINVSNPIVSVTPANPVICSPGSATLSAAVSPAGNYTYNWSPATGLNTTAGASVISTTTSTRAYTVTSTDGICTTSAIVTVSVSGTLPGKPVSINGINGTPVQVTGLCKTTLTYSCPAAPNATDYIWTYPPWVTGVAYPNLPDKKTIELTFGLSTMTNQGSTINVSSVNACGQSAPRSISVTAGPQPPGPITSVPATFCANQAGIVFSVPPSVGATFYSWLFPAGVNIQGPNNTNSVTVNWGSNNGTVVLNAGDSCGTRSITKTITLNCTSRIAAENQIFLKDAITLYPNPSTGLIYLSSVKAKSKIYVTNVLGQEIFYVETKKGYKNFSIDLGNEVRGIYTIRVENAGKYQIQIFKVVIE